MGESLQLLILLSWCCIDIVLGMYIILLKIALYACIEIEILEKNKTVLQGLK